MNVRAHPGELAVSRKLSRFVKLSAEDIHTLESVVGERVVRYGPREDIIQEGDKPDHCTVLISGWACRYKVLEDGRRQIVAILIPGDICDYGSFLMSRLDHSIGTLSPLTCGRVPRDRFDEFSREYPHISQAFLLDTLAAFAIQREWAVNLGQRDAFERLAHLFCELFLRLRAVGLTNGNSCEWPLTQSDLGEAAGISSVHVNRTIQELRAQNLVEVGGKALTIMNLKTLKTAALFNPNYLHVEDGL